jgi:predicted SAM-dependent methyltransferase
MDVDLAQIEDVDFVWRGEPLHEVVGGNDRYDWIIASHVIEHLPDPVGFFNGCREVLKPEGIVSLVVPDKRYCFDYFRPLSTSGDILDAFEQRRIRPTPGSVFDSLANCVSLEGQTSWSANDREGDFRNVYTFETAQNAWERAKRGHEDAHIWRFTPASFRLILQDLRSLGLLRFEQIHEFDTAGNEFFVTLGQRASAAAPTERTALLHQIDRELAEALRIDTTAREQPAGSAQTLALSPKEERMIVFKRRVVEGIRSPFKSSRP